MTVKRNYYHRNCPYEVLDPYRIAALYGMEDHAVFHAWKKLLVAGQRGGKDKRQDIEEAIWSLQRRLELWDEDDALFDKNEEVMGHQGGVEEEVLTEKGRLSATRTAFSNLMDAEQTCIRQALEKKEDLKRYTNKELMQEMFDRGLITISPG